jgi:hypothetical protein
VPVDTLYRNEVTLAGVLAEPPRARELAGGSELVTFVLEVGGQRHHCSVAEPRLRRRVLELAEGDRLEVSGSLQRRFAGRSRSPFSVVAVDRARRLRAGVRRPRTP